MPFSLLTNGVVEIVWHSRPDKLEEQVERMSLGQSSFWYHLVQSYLCISQQASQPRTLGCQALRPCPGLKMRIAHLTSLLRWNYP